MMKLNAQRLLLAAVVGCGLLMAAPVSAQTGDDSPPQLVGPVELFWVPDGAFFNFNAFQCAEDFLGIAEIFPYDPSVDTVDEYDLVIAKMTIMDLDFDQEDSMEEEASVRYFARANWVPVPGYPSPEPPPMPESVAELLEAPAFSLRRNGVIDQREMCLSFSIPQFNGRNQLRLRGVIDHDVLWSVNVGIADSNATMNEGDPNAGITIAFSIPIFAKKDPSFLGPNPQAFADAGADQRVAAGTTVVLDGSLTFDGTNIGFDGNNPEVLERDQITYTWEWVSGPVRVDPVYPDLEDEPEKAEVTLTQVGTYVYRLLADDGVNGVPTEDTVEIEVVSVILENGQPIARVEGPATAVVVGDIIQLNGGDSTDPDGDSLTFRWIQTNEIGTALSEDVIASVFQPLSGLDEPVSTWQAIKPGEYFFRLIVDDGELFDTATISVEVVEAGGSATLSPQNDGARNSPDNNGAEAPILAPTSSACGAAAPPLGLVGFALLLWRRLS